MNDGIWRVILTTGRWIWPTSWRKAVMTPKVMAPEDMPKTPQRKAAMYPNENVALTTVRANTVKRVRALTWSYSVS